MAKKKNLPLRKCSFCSTEQHPLAEGTGPKGKVYICYDCIERIVPEFKAARKNSNHDFKIPTARKFMII